MCGCMRSHACGVYTRVCNGMWHLAKLQARIFIIVCIIVLQARVSIGPLIVGDIVVFAISIVQGGPLAIWCVITHVEHQLCSNVNASVNQPLIQCKCFCAQGLPSLCSLMCACFLARYNMLRHMLFRSDMSHDAMPLCIDVLRLTFIYAVYI